MSGPIPTGPSKAGPRCPRAASGARPQRSTSIPTAAAFGSQSSARHKDLSPHRKCARPGKNDIIYVADSESESVSRNHDGWKRGIRVGRASDGALTAFIPDPVEKISGTSAAEGVAADAMGNIFGAEVGSKRVNKCVKN